MKWKYFGDISEEIIKDYDFYIFFNENLDISYPDNSLVFIKEDETFENIKDNRKLLKTAIRFLRM